jgi:hypothetical protein
MVSESWLIEAGQQQDAADEAWLGWSFATDIGVS